VGGDSLPPSEAESASCRPKDLQALSLSLAISGREAAERVTG
jgi:hypothetical protein